MKISKQFIIVWVLLVLLTIACGVNILLDTPPYSEDIYLLEKDGKTQYYWKYVNDDCIIYAKDIGKKEAREIAVFPPGSEEYYYDSERNSVISFGVCGEWLVASVGFYVGSEGSFLGDFVRFKKNGSELTHFYLTDSDRFIVLDDWVYYNFFEYHGKPQPTEGCYRIKPDETEKQYLGDIFSWVYIKDVDGYLYGKHDTDKRINSWNPITDLIRWKPDVGEFTTLFEGGILPEFDNDDAMGYTDLKIDKDSVTFVVYVHGNSEGDFWFGHWLYSARYSVNKDGSNLVLLKERYEGHVDSPE